MATVTIGGRVLDVKPCTVGMWKRKLRPYQKDVGTLDDDAAVDRTVDLLLAFVGHNEGVTAEWLDEQLPMPPHPVLAEVLRASGLQGAKPGEAASQ